MINKLKNIERKPVLFLLFGIGSIIFLPNFFTKGMFLDGLIYSSISMNLSNGLGTIWQPYYTGLNEGSFFEHPPLFFWVQGLWFNVIGNHIYTERLFDLIILFISFMLVRQICILHWVKVNFLVPMLLMLTVPKFSWAFGNNMMEILLVPILLWAFLILSKRRNEKSWYQLPLVSILFLSFFLIKGPVAIGVIFLPFVFIFNDGVNSALKNFIKLLIFSAIGLAVLLLYEPSRINITTYLNQQVIASVTGNRSSEHADTYFKIILGLIQELAIPLIITIVALVVIRPKVQSKVKSLLPILITGLAFSLPFSLFGKQHVYYIIPAIPFFCIYISGILESTNVIDKILFNRKAEKIIQFTGIILCVVGLSISALNFGSISRDSDTITDLEIIKSKTTNTEISISDALKNRWQLFAYSARYSLVDFDPRPNLKCKIGLKSEKIDGYESLNLDTKKYELFKINK
jgi:4-amino-4-deoxy-L-arabinose transferase-like glycosyltransferase